MMTISPALPSRRLALRAALPPLRAGRLADKELCARRAAMFADAPLEAVGGVPCFIAGNHARTTIVHFHGGGYRLGSAAGWAGFAQRLAEGTGARIVVPDYALAPEHPFPAALHDAIAVLEAEVARGPVILSGDSAGGGLALALASLLAAPTPLIGLMMLSPWLDLRLGSDSFSRCATSDALFSHAAASASTADYLQGHTADNPLASPLLADLSTLPPVLLAVGSDEVLCDESLSLAARLAQAGIRTIFTVEPGSPHIWPVLQPESAATGRTMALIADFVATVSSPDGAGSSGASG